MNGLSESQIVGENRLDPSDPSGRTAGRIALDWLLNRVLMGRTAVTFRCPACGLELRTRRRNSGRPGRCPACAVVFPVPPPVGRWSFLAR